MSLETRLREDVKLAMKAGAKEDLEVLRMLLSEAKYAAAAATTGGPEPASLSDELMVLFAVV